MGEIEQVYNNTINGIVEKVGVCGHWPFLYMTWDKCGGDKLIDNKIKDKSWGGEKCVMFFA